MFSLKKVILVVLATSFLTGCGGPSEEDCKVAIDKPLAEIEAVMTLPGRIEGDFESDFTLLVALTKSDPLVKENKELINNRGYESDNEREKFKRDLELSQVLEKAGYVKLEKGIFETERCYTSLSCKMEKVAAYKVTPTDKFKEVKGYTRIKTPALKVGTFVSDKISELQKTPSNENGIEYYAFTYTRKLANIPEGLTSDISKLALPLDNAGIYIKRKFENRVWKNGSDWEYDKRSYSVR